MSIEGFGVGGAAPLSGAPDPFSGGALPGPAPEAAWSGPARSAEAQWASRGFTGEMLRSQLGLADAGADFDAATATFAGGKTAVAAGSFSPTEGVPWSVETRTSPVRYSEEEAAALKEKYPSLPIGPDGSLDPDAITPGMVKAMSPHDAWVLMDKLASESSGTAHVHDGEGNLTLDGAPVNGAKALALKMFAAGDRDALAKLVAANPELFLDDPDLRGAVGKVLTPAMYAAVVSELQATSGISSRESDALTSLFHAHLEATAGDDPKKLALAATRFLEGVGQHGVLEDPEALGTVAGAIAAGMMKHLDAIEADDELMKEIGFAIADAAAGFVPGGEVAGAVLGVALSALEIALKSSDDPKSAVYRWVGLVREKLQKEGTNPWAAEGDPQWADKAGKALDWIETLMNKAGYPS